MNYITMDLILYHVSTFLEIFIFFVLYDAICHFTSKNAKNSLAKKISKNVVTWYKIRSIDISGRLGQFEQLGKVNNSIILATTHLKYQRSSGLSIAH